MALTPEFEHDIFISYAHNDNTALNGWVDEFCIKLSKALMQHTGSKDLDIWRDNSQIDGSTDFNESIRDGIEKTAILICITSPSYYNSKYCLQELDVFYTKARAEKIGLLVSKRSRIINLLINNIPHQNWPVALQSTPGFHFYNSKGKKDLGIAFDPNSTEFNIAIRDLRDAVYHLIQDIKDVQSGRPPRLPGENDGGNGGKEPIMPKKRRLIALRKPVVIAALPLIVIAGIVIGIRWKLIWGQGNNDVNDNIGKATLTAKADDTVQRANYAISDNERTRKLLLSLNRADSLPDKKRQQFINYILSVYFAPEFTVGLNYEKTDTSKARHPDGKDYLTHLYLKGNLANIIVTHIKTNDAHKITGMYVTEIHKNAVSIQTIK
ncbi:MAG: toll/interleukin-1 receptor domain-containing protein [Bacteroidota bacterium]